MKKFEDFKNNKLREKISELEHSQWASWAKHLIDNFTEENIKRWRKQINTKYSDLSEEDKDKDREWADKILKILKDFS